MTKNGGEPGRSRSRKSHLKALISCTNWPQMWMVGLANKGEAQLWLKANIVPLVREVKNHDGSTMTKLRPIALLEKNLKLIESITVDQHADHIIAMLQEQQVGFRDRDGAEVMSSEKILEEWHE